MKKYLIVTIATLAVLSIASCKKYLEIDAPINKVATSTVFTNDQSALSAVSALYAGSNFATVGSLTSQPSSSLEANGTLNATTSLGGTMADDIYSISNQSNNTYLQFYTNSLIPTNAMVNYIWQFSYPQLYNINSYIAGLTNSNSLTAATKTQLLGECYFFRAYTFFYLTNFYGDVPLVLTTDGNTNATIARSPQAKVYEQIVTDLKTAQGLLTNTYPSVQKARIALPVVNAMLARVYLYQKDWANAEAAATTVITNPSFQLATLSAAFTNTSTETIWQVATTLGVTSFGANFNAQLTNSANYVAYPVLANSFEAGDLRKTNWLRAVVVGSTTYYAPYKYKIQASSVPATTSAGSNEYIVVMRLAEQYLIRAEARAQQNNLSGANEDLKAIRDRAGLTTAAPVSQASLLLSIENERWHELFAEYGHRWLDLKRTGRAVTVLAANKNWTAAQAANQLLLPIYQNELNYNTNLTQNPGY